MKTVLHIGKPYIKNLEGKARLCTDCYFPDEGKVTLWYEVESKFSDYLVTEYSDAFVLSMVEKCMMRKWDIEFETPMTEDLYYNLSTYLIPVFCQNYEDCNLIRLIGDTTNINVKTEGGCVTGLSGGVDCFYTILKHKDIKQSKFKLTHLFLAANGTSNTGKTQEILNQWMKETEEIVTPIADQLELPLIIMNSNIATLYVKDVFMHGDVVITSSFIHAMRKLFSVYYYASGYLASQFEFNREDGGFSQDVVAKYVSVEKMRVINSGCEEKRIDKVEYISDNLTVQKNLNVCWKPKNCGHCKKCLRTMSELYVLGKLDRYQDVFPIKDFYNNASKRLAEESCVDSKEHSTEIFEKARQIGFKIPYSVYLYKYLWYKPYCWLRDNLKNNRTARRFYYKHNLDEKLMGYRQPEDMRRRRMEECN